MSTVRVKVRLTFPESEVPRPVLATMVRTFEVEPNIRRADVEEHGLRRDHPVQGSERPRDEGRANGGDLRGGASNRLRSPRERLTVATSPSPRYTVNTTVTVRGNGHSA